MMTLLSPNIQPLTHLSMLPLDSEIGNSSQASQAVVPGSPHRITTMFLKYPHRTHQARPSGSLILIRTQKKDMTCPENIPPWSGSSFPACISTRSTQCLCISQEKTLVAIPRALVHGAPGCRISGPWMHFCCKLDLGSWLMQHLVSFVLPFWVHLVLLLL